MSANAKVAAAKAATTRAAAGKKPVTTTGRCQCRAIEYQFTGEPKWVMHCHCESCRRAVSSAVATYVGVRLEQFSYLQGDPAIYESSPGVKRYFCATCGSVCRAPISAGLQMMQIVRQHTLHPQP